MHRGHVRDGEAGQRLGLRQVRRDHASPCGSSRRIKAATASCRNSDGAALGDHHRIDHQRHPRRMPRQRVGDRLDRRRIAQHAGLDRVGADVVQHARRSARDELRRHRVDRVHAQRVLRGQRGDRGRGIGAERGDRLDVGLDARPRRRNPTRRSPAPGRSIDAVAHAVGSHDARARSAASAIDRRTTRPRRVGDHASSSSPSAITRTSGSVPLSRISRRPEPFSDASAAAIACTHARMLQRRGPGEPHVLQPLRQRREHPAHLAGRPALLDQHRQHLQRGQQPVAGGGEVRQDDVAGLLAADIERRPRASAPPHSGRRPGCGAGPGRASRRNRSSPRLDITVATMPPPRSRPASSQDRAISARIWSPSMSSPCSSAIDQPVGVAVQRDAEMRAMLDAPGRRGIRARSSRSRG